MLELKGVSFSYNDQSVIDNISFFLPKGQHMSLIGESGSGKSTLLKLIYGLYDLNEGTISCNGKPVLGPKFNLIPGESYIKFLAQDFGLMPFTTTAENVGTFLSNIYKEKKNKRIMELLDLVDMADYAEVKVKNLSGGQQQRTALAMVLAHEPQLLLLDEPFSQTDTFRTNRLRRNLFEYLKEKQITCITATHDPSDVLSFSDHVIVMREGKLIASSTPETLYKNPPDKYTASLFGDINEIPLHYLTEKNASGIRFVYPHELITVSQSPLKAIVKNSYFKGSHYLIEAEYSEGNLFFEIPEQILKGVIVFLAVK